MGLARRRAGALPGPRRCAAAPGPRGRGPASGVAGRGRRRGGTARGSARPGPRAGGHPVAAAWCAHVAVRLSAERAPATVLAGLLGGADALRDTASLRLSPNQQARYDQHAASVHAALGEEAFAAAWSAGRALTQ